MAIIKKFIPLEGIKKGDLLLTYDGTEEVVESIEFVPSTEDVYNLEVSGNHNYYAEGILVHNKGFLGLDTEYKGSDEEVAAQVQHDKSAWLAAIEAMDLLSKRAEVITGTSAKMFEADVESKMRDYSAQQETAEFQAGQSGLARGSASRNVALGKESFKQGLETSEMGFQSEQEKTLLDIAQKQSSLYATYLAGMQSAGDIPQFSSTYTGGTEWSAPIKSGPLREKMGLACFPADIKVDGKKISEVKVGDMVSSYNEKTEIMEKAEIIRTFIHKHDDGYLVINGRIKATANHPFYIRRNV